MNQSEITLDPQITIYKKKKNKKLMSCKRETFYESEGSFFFLFR